jgi:hypothetical protein
LSFAVQLRFTYKYENSGLSQALLAGSPTAETWTSLPYFLETAGANQALDLYLQSPGVVTGTTPWGLRIRANKATLRKVGPTALAGGQMVMENYICVFQHPSSGDYAQVVIENAEDDFVWPTP